MNGQVIRAWGFSLTVHAFAVAAAVWLVSEIKPVVPKEVFRWDVAFIQPSPPEPVQEVKEPNPTPESPARPQPAPPVVNEQRRIVTEIHPIETKPVVETRPVQQAVQTQVVQTVGRPIETSMTRATQPTTTPSGSIPTERAVISREEATVTSATSAPVERESVQQAVAQRQAERAPATVQATPIQEARVRPEVSSPAEKPVQAIPPQPSALDRSPAQMPSSQSVIVHAAPATRADYGWLKDLLARKIKEVKRYPHTARLNRLEGKVVVHAVIREDGNLADVRIHESSGHDALDEDALETMRKACPLHMIHPLGRPQMAIRIPINYSLND